MRFCCQPHFFQPQPPNQPQPTPPHPEAKQGTSARALVRYTHNVRCWPWGPLASRSDRRPPAGWVDGWRRCYVGIWFVTKNGGWLSFFGREVVGLGVGCEKRHVFKKKTSSICWNLKVVLWILFLGGEVAVLELWSILSCKHGNNNNNNMNCLFNMKRVGLSGNRVAHLSPLPPARD